ncbi:MAG: SPOR domain-containing protein [Proteobacteria bacterium]|nr:SPOR domain-containing protein [Pseudomonadota bacterium]
MADDKNLDLLDLEDDDSILPELPESSPFCTPRPKRPWLLFALGALVIILATYIIISVIRSGGDDDQVISLDNTAPTPVATDTGDGFAAGADKLILGQGGDGGAAKPAPAPTVTAPSAPTVTAPAATNGTGAPIRVVGERNNNVKFNPDATATIEAPKPRPIAKPETVKPKPVAHPAAAKPAAGGYYVQFAASGTRAGAEAEAARLKAGHPGLFSGKQFVILAAEVNGATVYRVRIGGFASGSDANGFCGNAKSDGIKDCFVVKN